MTHANAERQARIRDDIRAERHRQHRLWGDQTHLPMGTGKSRYQRALENTRLVAALAEDSGTLDFALILREEVLEALASQTDEELREELIQVAAVAVQWVEAIDTRREAVT